MLLNLFRIYCILLALFTVSGCAILQDSNASNPHSINILDLKGNTRPLEDYLGSPTLLVLWASWCPECLAELGNLNTATRHLGVQGVQVIAVAIQDDLESVKSVPQVNHAIFPVLIDVKGELLDRYPTDGLPSAYLIGPEGEIYQLIDPEDGLTKKPVIGFRSWQSIAGQKAILDSIRALQ